MKKSRKGRYCVVRGGKINISTLLVCERAPSIFNGERITTPEQAKLMRILTLQTLSTTAHRFSPSSVLLVRIDSSVTDKPMFRGGRLVGIHLPGCLAETHCSV